MRVKLLENIEEQHGQVVDRFAKGDLVHFSAERAAELIAAKQAVAEPDPEYDAADCERQEAIYAAHVVGEISAEEYAEAVEHQLTVQDVLDFRKLRAEEAKAKAAAATPAATTTSTPAPAAQASTEE